MLYKICCTIYFVWSITDGVKRRYTVQGTTYTWQWGGFFILLRPMNIDHRRILVRPGQSRPVDHPTVSASVRLAPLPLFPAYNVVYKFKHAERLEGVDSFNSLPETGVDRSPTDVRRPGGKRWRRGENWINRIATQIGIGDGEIGTPPNLVIGFTCIPLIYPIDNHSMK